MSSAKPISLIGGLVNLAANWRFCVRLPLPFYRVRIEGVGIGGNEAWAGGNQDVVEAAIEFTASSHFDSRGVDAVLLCEILRDVEVALCSGIGCFVRRMFACDYFCAGVSAWEYAKVGVRVEAIKETD
jgi:hypothetical protein